MIRFSYHPRQQVLKVNDRSYSTPLKMSFGNDLHPLSSFLAFPQNSISDNIPLTYTIATRERERETEIYIFIYIGRVGVCGWGQ